MANFRRLVQTYRGLKLVVPPEMQQNPCLELDNGGSSRVLCPNGIREYSLHVGDNSCRECHVSSKISGCFVFCALCLFCTPVCCSISATIKVPPHAGTVGSKVHV
ncbi:hypothetical protein GQ457_08G027880 [Hibiscus cannabinus]